MSAATPASPVCDLCSAAQETRFYAVPGGPEDAGVQICATCQTQIDGDLDAAHWRCLGASMWSSEPAVQVLAARLLARLAEHDWARDLAEQLWLEDETRAWVDNQVAAGGHVDSNGAPLAAGDNVVLIKDLPVKGAGFTAKRGTAVRGISLVQDNPEHIEGRVEGQRIVILTKFVKKK
ncbi:PhnA domain-containing protein [Pseudophaeobacter sp.]|jgi:protein PhnA|uniref:PhnA domain-containing protein n=1 Tax=Pseudophaeobacter sp. TaxID=1971739 RepID=UPI003A97B768